MSNLTIEICKNRAATEARKKQIKQDAPDTKFETRIIEGLESAAMFLTRDAKDGGSTELLAEGFNSDLDVQEMAVLLIWTK